MTDESWNTRTRHASDAYDAALTAAGIAFDDVDLGRDE